MKGLLQKDIYVLTTQMRVFILLAVVFAAMPGTTMNAFAVVYAAMLPYTAIAYDERSKWDRLAAMLPYSSKQLVLSKYVLGYLCVLGIAAITLVVNLGMSLLPGRTATLSTLLSLVCVGFLMLGLTLPFMLGFGVEKGRMIMTFAMIALAIGSATFVQEIALQRPSVFRFINLLLPIIAAVVNLLSISLSIKLYSKRSI